MTKLRCPALEELPKPVHYLTMVSFLANGLEGYIGLGK